MTLRIVADVREDGTTIRLIGRMRAEHIAPFVRRSPRVVLQRRWTRTKSRSRTSTRFVFSWLPNGDGIVLQHCAPFIREWIDERSPDVNARTT